MYRRPGGAVLERGVVSYVEEFIQIRGRRIQLLRGGSGPELLYLHSAGGEVSWLPFFDSLARQFTLYIPAHPGFARSEGLEWVQSMADLASHTIEVMDALGLDRPPVVGLSLGGWLAGEMALREPSRISRLVLIGAVGLGLEEAPYPEVFAVNPAELRRILFADPESAIARSFVSDDPSPEVLQEVLKAREATARVAGSPPFQDPGLRFRLRGVKAPALILWGGEDRLALLEHARAWHAGISGSQLVILDGCGHAPPFERPEETAQIVAGFLKRV